MTRFLACLMLTALLAVPSRAAEPTKSRKRPSEPAFKDEGADTATHKEIAPLKIKFARLSTIRLTKAGALLAADEQAKEIKIISPEGKQIGTIKTAFGPESIDVTDDGAIYCGGQGQLVKMDASGKVLATAEMPKIAKATDTSRRGRGKAQRVSGLAVGDKYVYTAFGAGWSLGSKSKLLRFDPDLKHPKLLAEDLRCCCQRCDIAFINGTVYLAENARHRVVQYDSEGKVLGKWGKRARTGLEGFGVASGPEDDKQAKRPAACR